MGSRPRAFQQAIDYMRMLPLTHQSVAQKANLSFFFVNKIQIQSNKVCYKVYSGKAVVELFPDGV